MSETIFDRFEELVPSGREDVPVTALSELLNEIPEPSGETRIAAKMLSEFKRATKLKLPLADGIHLWLGHCVGAFHECPRREEFFLFALQRRGETLTGYATGLEADEPDKVARIQSQPDVDRITSDSVHELIAMLNAAPTNLKRSDWFSPLSPTDGPSVAFTPASSARYFIRQFGGKLLFVQPARCGGWYGELWPKAV